MRMTTDDEHLVAVHVWDLTHCVYRFSWDKFVRRIKKKWTRFGDFFATLAWASFKELD